MQNEINIRPAEDKHVELITELLNTYAKEHLLLPRTREDVQKRLSNFIVAEINGDFAGCMAVRDFGDNLYEVRSLAVKRKYEGNGIGTKLVSSAVENLKNQAPCRIFALTYRSKLFIRMGFSLVSKDLFPQKIWSDCAVCAKKDCCDEEAVLMEFK
jgi:amino-acid N-acetyltransferase